MPSSVSLSSKPPIAARFDTFSEESESIHDIIVSGEHFLSRIRHYGRSLSDDVLEINTFVSNLKEFSQVKEKVEERWFEITPLIERVLSICNVQLKKNVKSFVTDIPENLPRIWSDPFFLEQILLNLLVNAAQAVESYDIGSQRQWGRDG